MAPSSSLVTHLKGMYKRLTTWRRNKKATPEQSDSSPIKVSVPEQPSAVLTRSGGQCTQGLHKMHQVRHPILRRYRERHVVSLGVSQSESVGLGGVQLVCQLDVRSQTPLTDYIH